MRLKYALAAFILTAAILIGTSVVPIKTRADAPYAKHSMTFTTTGNLPAISLTGQSSCSYAMSGTGSATVTPKGSSDSGTTYGAITSAGFGAQTANGIYGGALIPASGAPITTNFFVAVTGVSGTVTVTEVCSGAVAVGSGSGGGGGGGNVVITGPLDGNGNVKVAAQGSPLPSPSPANYPGFVGIKQGTGTTEYLDGWPDQDNYSTSITTATTTLLVSGVAGQNMYVWRLYTQASGANTTDFVQAEWGTGATCGTGTHPIGPAPQQAPASLNNTGSIWAGSLGTGSSAFGAPAVAAAPLIVPAGNNLCGVTTGTTISVYFVWDVAIHAN